MTKDDKLNLMLVLNMIGLFFGGVTLGLLVTVRLFMK